MPFFLEYMFTIVFLVCKAIIECSVVIQENKSTVSTPFDMHNSLQWTQRCPLQFVNVSVLLTITQTH